MKHLLLLSTVLLAILPVAASFGQVRFEKAEPIWTAAEKGEVNSSVAFVSGFDWDGALPLKLRLSALARTISKIGYTSAALVALVSLFNAFVLAGLFFM